MLKMLLIYLRGRRAKVGFTKIVALFFLSLPLKTHAFGSGSTLTVTSTSPTVCGVVSAKSTQSIICYTPDGGGEIVNILPNTSFSSISGGDTFFCGIRSGGYAFLCWDTSNRSNSPEAYNPQRVYYNTSVLLESIAVGGDQICGTLNDTGKANDGGSVKCWRGEYVNGTQFPVGNDRFVSISSGYGFSCGILISNSRIKCWGRSRLATEIESQFGDMSMFSIVAGGFHVCGINSTGFLVCKGENFSGQLDVPVNSFPGLYTPQGVFGI